MPQIRYEVAGVENVETIPDDLVPYYTGRMGYTLVYSDAEAEALKGAELLEAARQAGVEAPTTLTADEKRHAIVEATAPAGAELPAIIPDPEPAPARTTKRRTAADRGE